MRRRRPPRVYRMPKPLPMPRPSTWMGDIAYIAMWTGIATAILCAIVLVLT